ncbi:unnamed protein product [Caretta caretta]
MTGLVLREPELRLVLSAYADDVLLVVQDPGDLVRVEACQAIYSAASSARVNWVKSSGLAVGDWRQGDTSDAVMAMAITIPQEDGFNGHVTPDIIPYSWDMVHDMLTLLHKQIFPGMDVWIVVNTILPTQTGTFSFKVIKQHQLHSF